MKVLFGVNNDNNVKGIVDFYEQKYGEKIEYKNVYYFKQLIQELASGEYDRAVVLEDLEKFPTNNYAQIDEYLFQNIDAMTDSFDSKNIIFITSERRKLGDEFLTKLFNLGIYTCLTGQDRTKGKVSDAINKPYIKKDVKKYYDKVSGENVYKSGEVSEIEIQRIISYYKNQNGIADKYNEIFDRISTQYTDEQLKVIIKFLPYDVKQYLSFNNEKYKALDVSMSPDVPDEASAPERIMSRDANAMEIKREPQMADKIVVQAKSQQPKVITQVVEKEIVKSFYEVPKDYKKTVCFVGAPKVGTTFCVNAIATYLARSKVHTAIVDVTRKRDSYVIYTYDNEGKRNIAAESLKYASSGLNEPLIYDKLSIYTGMPGDDRKNYNVSLAMDTIIQHNNAIIIDADFTTPADFFRLCQEIYVVQDMDVLNIPQLTMFLREIKNRGVPLNKIRIVINKQVDCVLTVEDILDGIATYTSYDYKMFDTLFNAASIPYFVLPFHEENYRKYVEMIYKYTNTFSTFTEDFRTNLNKLINTIYPVGGVQVSNQVVDRYSSEKRGKSRGMFRK